MLRHFARLRLRPVSLAERTDTVIRGWRLRVLGKTRCAALATAFLLGMACNLGATGTRNSAGYRILARYSVGSRVGAVRVDSATRRIFVATTARVDVLNADTGAEVGNLPVSDPRDVLVIPALKRGFVSSGAANSIAIFNTETLKITKMVHLTGENPDALAYDPGVKRVFVAETGSGEVAAINAQTGDLISSVALSGQLQQMAANGYGELFVAADGKDTIEVVDTQTLKFLGDFPLHANCRPFGLALDPHGRRLFVACRDGILQIIDTDIGFTFETLPIGTGGAGEEFTFNPQGKGGWKGATFVVTSDGTLSLIRMDAFIRYSDAGKVALEPGTRSVAYDAKTHRVFVSAGSVLLVVGQ